MRALIWGTKCIAGRDIKLFLELGIAYQHRSDATHKRGYAVGCPWAALTPCGALVEIPCWTLRCAWAWRDPNARSTLSFGVGSGHEVERVGFNWKVARFDPRLLLVETTRLSLGPTFTQRKGVTHPHSS